MTTQSQSATAYKMLEEIQASGYATTCRNDVATYILSNYETDEEIKTFLDEITSHGCVSGMIPHLIYYTDTNKYYDEFQEDIENSLANYGDSCGAKNRFESISYLQGADSVGSIEQEKNLLAWFGFENAAYEIAQELFPDTF